jgi:hypothetical protein
MQPDSVWEDEVNNLIRAHMREVLLKRQHGEFVE